MRQRCLIIYCATKWVNSHYSVLVFLDLIQVVVDTNNAVIHAQGAEITEADAAAISEALHSSGFPSVSHQVAAHCLPG